MIINLAITFKTEEPLTQEQGKKFWQMALHFGARGACTYRFAAMESGTDFWTILSAAREYIQSVAGQDIEITKVEAEVNEVATKLAVR